MKHLLLVLLLISANTFAQVKDIQGDFSMLKEGDLLFYYSQRDNPITDVTKGIDGKKISHVAIFHRKGKSAYALEATHRGVVLTPVDSISKHRKEIHILVGRLKDTTNVAASVKEAMKYLGKPYDFYFDAGDSALYCSELVQLTYRNKSGKLIFSPIPMSFHNDKGEIIEYWKRYYAKVGRKVPEGEAGSNPGELSQSKAIDILYRLL